MKTDFLPPQVQKVIVAAVAYAELAERCHVHHESRTKEMQRAANLARIGNQAEAKRILSRLDLGATVVFDFTDVQKALVRACKPFRKASAPDIDHQPLTQHVE